MSNEGSLDADYLEMQWVDQQTNNKNHHCNKRHKYIHICPQLHMHLLLIEGICTRIRSLTLYPSIFVLQHKCMLKRRMQWKYENLKTNANFQFNCMILQLQILQLLTFSCILTSGPNETGIATANAICACATIQALVIGVARQKKRKSTGK